MKISVKGRYGLRVMIELALRYGKGPVPVELIAENQRISGKYIHILVSGLKSAGLIRGVRGPHGGYELMRAPSDITAFDVVSVLESDLVPSDCVSNSARCSRSNLCATRDLWCEIADAAKRVLTGTTLDMLARQEREKADRNLSYAI